MELSDKIINWYTQNKIYINISKDILFALGAVATIYGYFKFLKFLAQRKVINKKAEMKNDLRLFGEIKEELKKYVDSYEAKSGNLRDISVRLMYMKNYPYKLKNDGYGQMLYYYFLSDAHKATGYISSKGIYVMDHLLYFGNAIYYNEDNMKWFVDKKDKRFKNYKQLPAKQLVKRLPFSNLFGYDFNSDWAEGEPVFYVKFKYYQWRLFADDMEAVDIDQQYHLANKIDLSKSRRARRMRFYLQRLKAKATKFKYK